MEPTELRSLHPALPGSQMRSLPGCNANNEARRVAACFNCISDLLVRSGELNVGDVALPEGSDSGIGHSRKRHINDSASAHFSNLGDVIDSHMQEEHSLHIQPSQQ